MSVLDIQARVDDLVQDIRGGISADPYIGRPDCDRADRALDILRALIDDWLAAPAAEPVPLTLDALPADEQCFCEFYRGPGDGLFVHRDALLPAREGPSFAPMDRKVVDCDDDCGAFDEPLTLAEFRTALDHWRSHGYLAGCSHAH